MFQDMLLEIKRKYDRKNKVKTIITKSGLELLDQICILLLGRLYCNITDDTVEISLLSLIKCDDDDIEDYLKEIYWYVHNKGNASHVNVLKENRLRIFSAATVSKSQFNDLERTLYAFMSEFIESLLEIDLYDYDKINISSITVHLDNPIYKSVLGKRLQDILNNQVFL